MKLAVLYASKHGHTEKVSKEFPGSKLNVRFHTAIENYDVFFILCPTYGDEELPLAMEDYLLNLKVTGKKYALCELGNYYGYENRRFGAAKIIEHELTKLNWIKIATTLSLDSMPSIDWNEVRKWKEEIDETLGIA